MNLPPKIPASIESGHNVIKAITLIELNVCLVTISIILLTIYGIYTYTHGNVLNAERRARVHNELSFALEHMSKYVQQGNGNTANPPITAYPASGTQTGFRVRCDFNNPPTPSSLTDDAWVNYSLSGNTLSTSCTGTCGSFVAENLSGRIISGFVSGIMPNNPTNGFYVSIDASGNIVEVGLVGRYNPSQAYAVSTKLLNPQVEMKTKIICINASTH